LETAYFDELLLAINYIPFLRFRIAVDYVASFEEVFRIEGLSIGGRVFEITIYYYWTTDANCLLTLGYV
jgi:hypothetical protein